MPRMPRRAAISNTPSAAAAKSAGKRATRAAKGKSATATRGAAGKGKGKAATGNTKSVAKGRAAKATGKGKKKAAPDSDSDGLAEPTGLTSDEDSGSDSSALSDMSDASDFEPGDDEIEAVSVVSVSSGEDEGSDWDDAPPRKKARTKVAGRNVRGIRGTPADTKPKRAPGPMDQDRKASQSQKPPKSSAGTGASTSNSRRLSGGAAITGLGALTVHVVGGRRVTSLGEELSDDDDVDLADGQEVVGRIFPAPKRGRVSRGRISRNTLAFLGALMDPTNNDRDWLRVHDPAFRQAEREFRDFVDVLQEKIAEVDEEVPVLPAKDICHRIYRDIRFSSDKTPYKCNFAFTTSRGGRKGIWAKYHLYIEPGFSVLACGLWQPDKPVLERLRARILASTPGPGPLRAAITNPEFVALFGPAERASDGSRQNVFGYNDELKVAPKGIEKTHPQIDLLRLRTIAVVKPFTDEEVLDPRFSDTLAGVVAVMRPFVHTLNDYIAE